VPDCKQTEKQQVDDDGLGEIGRAIVVDRRLDEIANETEAVKK
jgi:hypothetical protein